MESEKRYGYDWLFNCICDRKNGDASMTVQEVIDRLNALEAERDALVEELKDAEQGCHTMLKMKAERDYMSEALDVATEKYHKVVESKVALEAERDRLREAVIEVIDNHQILNTRDVCIDMDTLRRIANALKGGGDGE